jgi:hypothetical protein
VALQLRVPAFDAEADRLIEHGAVYVDQSDVGSVLSIMHPTLQHGYACATSAAARHGARTAVPRSYQAAVTGPAAAKWIAANAVELDNHARNGTFVECYVATSVWLLNSMWIYEVKHDGRHKARLVALGNQLKERAGDPERSSPTAGQLEFRTIVAISTEMGWPMFSYDVTSAYLYGKVPTGVNIFMRAPLGYKTKLPPKAGFAVALRLFKGLYGLNFAGVMCRPRACSTSSSRLVIDTLSCCLSTTSPSRSRTRWTALRLSSLCLPSTRSPVAR